MSLRTRSATLAPPDPLSSEQRPASRPTPTVSRVSEAVFGPVEPSKQAIRERAYQLYLARNGAPGDAEADWLTAERQLREELAQQPTRPR